MKTEIPSIEDLMKFSDEKFDELTKLAIKETINEELNKKIKELQEEIERLNKERNKLYENGLNDFLELQKKRVENKRLNNIINELEHHLYQEWLEWKDSDCESIYSRAGEDKAIYDYLQELKGSDKE